MQVGPKIPQTKPVTFWPSLELKNTFHQKRQLYAPRNLGFTERAAVVAQLRVPKKSTPSKWKTKFTLPAIPLHTGWFCKPQLAPLQTSSKLYKV